MLDEDALMDMDTNTNLRAIAGCLRRAAEEVEAAAGAEDTPLAKIDRVAAALEALGDRLDSLAGWAPLHR